MNRTIPTTRTAVAAVLVTVAALLALLGCGPTRSAPPTASKPPAPASAPFVNTPAQARAAVAWLDPGAEINGPLTQQQLNDEADQTQSLAAPVQYRPDGNLTLFVTDTSSPDVGVAHLESDDLDHAALLGDAPIVGCGPQHLMVFAVKGRLPLFHLGALASHRPATLTGSGFMQSAPQPVRVVWHGGRGHVAPVNAAEPLSNLWSGELVTQRTTLVGEINDTREVAFEGTIKAALADANPNHPRMAC